ncbi:MAG: hypothetical protein JNJ73_08220 [Hyphomonadaceae bacterium]|nr:hypothetical protein [Hyphomonadaceae bacterium]
MADKYEERIVRDADGRVIEQVEVKPRKRGGGFGWGMLAGLFIIAAAVLVFAYSQGSFQTAGAQADHATAQAERNVGDFAENAGDAAEQAGDNIKSATN